MLRTEGLAVAYGKIQVVTDVTIEVGDRRIVAVLGRNGAGKTTTVKAICGLLPVRSGSVRFDDLRLDGKPAHRVARHGIALVPQGRELFPGLSVLDNLRLGAYTVRDRAKIADALEQVFHYFPPLRDRRAQTVGSLSGGEQQMVAIGRALMIEPRLLILDEPSAGLAPKVLREVFDIVARFSREQGTSVLVAEQNAREALRVADHLYIIDNGLIAADGSPAEMLSDDRLLRSYLGTQVDGETLSGLGPVA
jgi:branched-chain amino acid transport system ATP-binding protein